jgi:prophage DNA circulation protein
MVKDTDNIQLLAYRHLQDPTRWWVVADANPHIRYPFDFVMGKTIHVPE